MKAVVVRNSRSKLAGAACRAGCGQVVRPGQAVLWAPLPNLGYAENRFVVHVDCIAAKVDQAPPGEPVERHTKAAVARLRREVRATGSLFGAA